MAARAALAARGAAPVGGAGRGPGGLTGLQAGLPSGPQSHCGHPTQFLVVAHGRQLMPSFPCSPLAQAAALGNQKQ